VCCQSFEGQLPRQQAHQAILLALHHAPGDGLQIVIAAQVERAVDEVANEFGLPGGAKLACLSDGRIDTNENFTVQPSGSGFRPGAPAGGRLAGRRARPGPVVEGDGLPAVIEGEYVGGAVVVEELPVQTAHFRRSHEVHPQGIGIQAESLREQDAGDAAEPWQVDATRALAVAQDQLTHGRHGKSPAPLEVANCACRAVPRRR